MYIDSIIRSHRKTLAIQITGDGKLIVRAPKRTSNNCIETFIQTKINWIQAKQQQAKNKYAEITSLKYQAGAKLPYLGKLYKIKFTDNKNLVFYDNQFLFNQKTIKKGEQLFASWCKIQTKNHVIELINNYSKKFNLTCSAIKIGSAKKTLGSCNNSGALNFSWRIITLPPQIIEYIVVHELAHLKHLNHAKNFWHQVEQMLPDYKTYKKWLKNNSHLQ